ncbi:unnamed protein product [Rhizophagus irregularis]|nr:unnamed protein product [Rhizophagus irregularis]
MKQTYFCEPKYSKNYLISKPQNLYEQYELQQHAQNSWREIRTKDKNIIQNIISELLKTPVQPSFSDFSNFSSKRTPITEREPSPNIIPEPSNDTQFPQNAIAQKYSFTLLQNSKTELYEYNKLLYVTTSSEFRTQFTSKIRKFEEIIMFEENKLKKLKGNAAAQIRTRNKKRQKLEKENIVEMYDTPGQPSFLMNDPSLLEKMHNCIKFGVADHKRCKEVIKVQTIKHLREKMEEDYGIFMGKSTIQKYLQPRHSGIKEAQLHHHPAQIRLAAVGRNEMNEHIDEHYCLASVKGVSLGIVAVGKTFKTLQTANEPVSVPDHDFPKGAKHKLIPSVYLVINPSNTNDSLRSGKMRIFVRPEYFLRTSCETHMVDLVKITEEKSFHEFTHHDGIVKLIWCLLTDGRPDKNPQFLANIMKYVLLFKKLDLDYLTVRTHAPGQSAYNPVERSMASLSGKLAGIVFNAFNYGNHLGNMNGQSTIIDEELARKNFKHAGDHLCEIWNRNLINGHPVDVTYIDEHDHNIFLDTEVMDCCRPPRAPDVFDFLSLNGGFLPPVVQGKDKHFLSLLHTLEYVNDRLPGYDMGALQ